MVAGRLVFVLLGVTNAWRNLGKSLLAILGMAVAAAVLTASLSLTGGHPGQAFAGQRAYLGGDVVVFPFKYEVAADDDLPGAVFDRVPPDLPGDLRAFFPEVYQTGFLRLPAPPGLGATPASPPAPDDPEAASTSGRPGWTWADYQVDPAAVAAAAARNPVLPGERVAVYPHYFLPVLEEEEWSPPFEGVPEPPPETLWTPRALRSRDIALDAATGFGSLITAGRYFEPADAGRLVCVVDANRGNVSEGTVGEGTLPAPRPPEAPPSPGDAITVLVPRPVQGPDGRVEAFDYTSLTPVTLEVVGVYSLPTQVLNWVEVVEGRKSYRHEQLFWVSPDILVPEETLRAVFALAGGDPGDLAPVEVALALPDLSRAEDYASSLQELLPGNQVITVPRLVLMGRHRGLPEVALRAPDYGDPSRRVQPALPVDAGGALVVLVYLIAAFLLATNMMVLLDTRRKELGVLRALGARPGEVLVTLLTEAATLSVLGGLGGFALTRVASTYVLLSNKVPLADVAALTAADLGRVLGVTVGFALVFGLGAARTAISSSPTEVLRQE